jgi:hypothetical protein
MSVGVSNMSFKMKEFFQGQNMGKDIRNEPKDAERRSRRCRRERREQSRAAAARIRLLSRSKAL